MANLDINESNLIFELMKDSRRSDRELAHVMGVSQPTVSRIIKKLQKGGVIKEYTVIPDFRKLGFEILAITFLALEKEPQPGTIAALENVLMFESGLGLRYSHVVISLHEHYSSYAEFQIRLKHDLSTVRDSESFLVNLADENGFFPFSALAQHLRQTQKP